MGPQQRRVVVTGIGLVTPLGTNAPTAFQNLLAGKTGLVPLHRAPFFLPSYLSEDKQLPTLEKQAMLKALVEAMPCKVVGAVIEDEEDTYYYDWENKASVARRKRLAFAPTAHEPRGFRFCAKAVDEALRDALLLHPTALARDSANGPCTASRNSETALIGVEDPKKIGVNIGMGIPSLSDVTDVTAALTGDLRSVSAGPGSAAPGAGAVHYSRINPFFVPKILGNMAAGATAIKYNCQGFIGSSVAACATGAHCIGESFMVLQRGVDNSSNEQSAFADFLQRQGGTANGTGEQTPVAREEADGAVDIMICGATEACITPVSIGGFARMRALSTARNHTDEAATASRPFDVSRDGFVMSEGAGILILEEYNHAQRRIERYLQAVRENHALDADTRAAFATKSVEDFIYGEVKGFGASCDAHHVAAPHPHGRGAEACLRSCFRSAHVLQDRARPNAFYTPTRTTHACDEKANGHIDFAPLHIGYVNAHATGTIGDGIELDAIRRVFRVDAAQTEAGAEAVSPSRTGDSTRSLCVSSSKGSLGHLLGAAGSAEAAVALLALREQVAPPTAHLREPCLSAAEQAGCGLRLNNTAEPLHSCDGVISTSFGFGGINTALLFTKVR